MQKLNPNEKSHRITVVLDDSMYKELTRIAEVTGQKRSAAARNMLLMSFDIFKDFEKVGLVSFAKIYVKVEKALKKSLSKQMDFSDLDVVKE